MGSSSDNGLNNWIEEGLWRKIQNILPIITIDVLPLNHKPTSENLEIGLILRETADDGKKWCFLGGRLLYGEKLWEGVKRQVRITLGKDVIINETGSDHQPLYVAQYFNYNDNEFLRDPRQHAVGLTYAVPLSGIIKPRDEALDFKWFNLNKLPPPKDFGFNHDILLSRCLELLNIEK